MDSTVYADPNIKAQNIRTSRTKCERFKICVFIDLTKLGEGFKI